MRVSRLPRRQEVGPLPCPVARPRPRPAARPAGARQVLVERRDVGDPGRRHPAAPLRRRDVLRVAALRLLAAASRGAVAAQRRPRLGAAALAPADGLDGLLPRRGRAVVHGPVPQVPRRRRRRRAALRLAVLPAVLGARRLPAAAAPPLSE